jgi:hypothetical protein
MPGRSRILSAGRTAKPAPVPFHPTVIIGLGGTGKEVLLRLRRKFFEKYDKPGLPVLAYLWIDTDLRDIALDGQRIDYIADEIRFQPTEMVDGQVSPEAFMTYFRNRNAYPNIFKWMDPAMEAHGSVVEGAKAFRPLGRLGFFHAFGGENGIEQKLLSHSKNIQTQSAQNEMQEIARIDTTKVNVYIVTSIAGGTGSGMFLDMAFLAKNMINNANVCGFIVLPSLFTVDPGDRRYANGYAALKELEFYSLRKDLLTRPLGEEYEESTGISFHDFDVEWRLGDRKSIWGPPFNTCYMIDNSTNYGGSIMPDQKIEICDMIAESIFMDFSPDTDTFASQKRSIRENLAPQLLNDLEYEYLDSKGSVVHTEILSYRFSTFGWSKIYIPLDRIINACTYKLGEDIVDFWLRQNTAPGDMKEELKRDTMSKLGIGMRDVSTADIFTFLSKINDVGDGVTKVISQWVANLEQNCLDKIKSKTRELRKFISAEYDSFMRQQFNTGGLDVEGEFVKRIKTTNKDALLRQASEALLSEVGRMIANRNIRIDLTAKCLGSICELLDAQVKSYNDDLKRAETQATKWTQKIERGLQILSDSENTWIYRNITLRTYVKHTSDAIRSYLNMRARMLIDETAIEVCEELKNRIGYEAEVKTADGKIEVKRGGMILELRQLEDSLRALKARLNDKFDSYDRAEQHVIHLNLYKKGDFGAFYLVNGQAVNDSTLASLDGEFFTSSKIKSLIELKNLFRSPGIQYVESEIADFCARKFIEIKTKSESDATKAFMRQYTDEQQRNQMVNRFYTMGAGWLKKGAHFMGDSGVMNNIKSMAYLGIASKPDDEYDDFVKIFKRSNNTADRQNVDSSLICYYSELAGIPLMYINDLDRYKQGYLEIARKPGAGLHIDRFDEKFTDILLKSDTEVAALREAIRILLTGTILGAVDVFVDKDERLGYKYMRAGTQPFPLGHEYMAIEMIRSNFTLRAELDHRITDAVSGFGQDKLIQYFAILDYYTNKLFMPKFYKVGNMIEEKLSHEHRALSPVQEEIKNTILSTISEEQFKERLGAITGRLDEFSVIVGDRRVFKR